ncbi:retrovirus-related pol polyprotein from transposon TNT 1-94 [Tanacetum coccineum]
MGSNEEIRRLAREAEKQQLFAQKVQQQNMTLTSQLELYKERNRILEGINKDNNYLNEFLEADERAKRYNKQAQSQFVRDRDIIRDLEKQRDKLKVNNCMCLILRKLLRMLKRVILKMNEFQKDEKVQELKTQPIDYGKLNKLYDNFVPQKDLSAEQTYFPSSCISFVSKISSEDFSSKTKPSIASMPSANPMLVDLNEMENIFQTLFKLIQKSCKIDVQEMNPIVQKLYLYFILFQNRFKKDVKGMKDVFVSVKNDLDETFKQNEILKDRLLEASLAEDIKNLGITSCVEIRNKDLHDEIERISKESKDVSIKSKTIDTVCNDAFEVSQGLSKTIVKLEKDLSNFEAMSIAFEIALQHKSQENNSLKIVQKENENFMASLQLENAHLKQTYKDLFESVQRSKVETNQCDEVKVKDNFDEIETKNIELEYRATSLIKENEHLKLTYKNLFDSIKKSNVLEKNEFFKKSPGEKQHLFENKTSVFQIKIDELEKVLTQQTKDFNAVKLELSNITAKFEAYFEKLEKTKVFLEQQLARKVDDSKAEKDQFLKEINHLRTQLENLKGKSVKTKFDKHSILGKPPADKLLINSQISKSWFTPKVDMQKSLSKPVTAQSLPKNEKDQLLKRIAYLESKLASQDIRSCQKEYHELRTLYNALKTRASNAKNQFFEASHSCFTPVKQVWRPIKESQTFEASTSQKSFKTSTLKGKNQVFVTPHSRFTPVKQVWRPKQSHSKSFTYSKSEMLSMQNKNDSASTINKKGRFSNDAKTNFRNVSSNDNKKWKSSSSTRFKNPQETPSFNNQWKIKRNFKSPLIPRELFSNETPVSSPRWNSTSLHRIDTTLKWFSKLGKPVSTVLKWVPKLFDVMKQYQKEVNEIRAERIAKNANPLALVAAAQQYPNPYYQVQKSYKSYAPPSKQSSSTRSHASTRYKGKEIVKPITPPSESASEEDSDPKQAQRDSDMQKNLALIAKYFKKIYKPTNNNLRTSLNTKNKNMDTSPMYKNDNQTGQFGNQRTLIVVGARETVGSQDTDEELDEQELEAHYSYMAKIQEGPTAESRTDFEPLEKVQYNAEYNMFANDRHHSEQPESINNTCVVEKVDSNVILDSPNMCDNDIQNDQNAEECDDERVALANLIANLTLDTEENKKILKKLKKANASLIQELKECKSNLEESNTTRDSCLIALQSKQAELEMYKTLNDLIVDYEKLERKLNETLGLLAQKEIDIKKGLNLTLMKFQLTKKPKEVPVSTRKPKSQANNSVATPHKKIVALESIIRKSKSYYRMLYERTSKAWAWWIAQQCPSGYKWVPKTKKKWLPKVRKEDVNTSISPTIDNASRITNFLKITNTLRSNLSNVPSSSNSLAYCATHPIHYFLILTSTTLTCFQKKDIVIGLPKLKYVKDQLCSSCEVIKAKRSSFKTKAVPSSKGRLNLLHMDLCGLMRVKSINRKKYILVIVDDYSRYTWTLFLLSKDETPEVLKDFLKMIQRNLQAQLITVRTNRVIATACYTQNRSILIPSHEKIAYHIINDRKPSIRQLHIFGCTCYLTRDGENLDKMKEKRNPCILFDEIKEMTETSVENNTSGLVLQLQKALDYDNSGPAPQLQNVSPSAYTTAPSQQELDLLFDPLYDEFFTTGTSSVNKSSSPTDNSTKQDTQPTMNIHPLTEPKIPTTTVHAEENNDNQVADAHFEPYEFVNPLCTLRVRFASPTPSHEVGESSAAGAARVGRIRHAREGRYSIARGDLLDSSIFMVDVVPGHPMSRELNYGITDTWDDLVGAIEEIAPTTLKGVNHRVTNLSTTAEQETTIIYDMIEDAQDDQMAREAWELSIDASDYACSDVMSLHTTVVAQSALISELQSADHRQKGGLQTQMVEFQRQHGPAKGPAQPDAPGEAGSSS